MEKKSLAEKSSAEIKICNAKIISLTLGIIYIVSAIPWFVITTAFREDELIKWGIIYHFVVMIAVLFVNGAILSAAYTRTIESPPLIQEEKRLRAWKMLAYTIGALLILTIGLGIPLSFYIIQK